MPVNETNLNSVAEVLEHALAEGAAGREPEWIAGVDRAFAAVEEGVRRRAESLRSPDGHLVEVDRPRLPSPAVDRRTEELERRLHELLERAQSLRGQVRGAAEGIGLEQNPAEVAGALSVAPEAGAVAALGVFRQQAHELAEALRHFEEQAADLVLDSVTPDLGAGD
jgi:hypothetical protein